MYQGIASKNSLCKLCYLNTPEDELHLLFKCPAETGRYVYCWYCVIYNMLKPLKLCGACNSKSQQHHTCRCPSARGCHGACFARSSVGMYAHCWLCGIFNMLKSFELCGIHNSRSQHHTYRCTGSHMHCGVSTGISTNDSVGSAFDNMLIPFEVLLN